MNCDVVRSLIRGDVGGPLASLGSRPIARRRYRATEPRAASPPIRVTVVPAGVSEADAGYPPTVPLPGRPSKLTARAKPAGLHWDRNGLTNLRLADSKPNSTSFAFLLCLARASVRSRLDGTLHDGVRRGAGRPSSQHVPYWHRDRVGLTSPHVLGRTDHATRTSLGSCFSRVLEGRPVHPHPVHNDGQLARHRHVCLLVPDALGELYAPRL